MQVQITIFHEKNLFVKQYKNLFVNNIKKINLTSKTDQYSFGWICVDSFYWNFQKCKRIYNVFLETQIFFEQFFIYINCFKKKEIGAPWEKKIKIIKYI